MDDPGLRLERCMRCQIVFWICRPCYRGHRGHRGHRGQVFCGSCLYSCVEAGFLGRKPDGRTKLYVGKEDVLDALLTGVLQSKLVTYAYQGSRRRPQRGTLAPYAMLLHKHGLYVLGARIPDGEKPDLAGVPTTVFAADRFSEADHVRRSSFAPLATFKLADVVQGAFGIHVGTTDEHHDVVIEFTKERASYARSRLWHPSQQLDEASDGTVRVRFRCSNLAPVVSWVLEWGSHARAIEPPALVSQVVAELDAARARYTR